MKNKDRQKREKEKNGKLNQLQNQSNGWADYQFNNQKASRAYNDRESHKRIGEHNDRAYRTDAYSQACFITRWLLP